MGESTSPAWSLWSLMIWVWSLMIYNGKPSIYFVNQLFPIEKHEISRRRSNLAHLASLAVQNRYRTSLWMNRHPYRAILWFFDFWSIFGSRIQKNTENFAKFRYLDGFGDLRKVPGTFRDQKKIQNPGKMFFFEKIEKLWKAAKHIQRWAPNSSGARRTIRKGTLSKIIKLRPNHQTSAKSSNFARSQLSATLHPTVVEI